MGTTYYVNTTTVSDGNDGSVGSPWQFPAKAWTMAVSQGGAVSIDGAAAHFGGDATGLAVYYGNVMIGSVSSYILQQSQGGPSTGPFGVSVNGTLTVPNADNVYTNNGDFGPGGGNFAPTLTLPNVAYVYTDNGNFGVGGTGFTPTLTLPAVEKVDTTNGPYGVNGTASTPTLNLTNMVAGNIKSGVVIGGVTGTLASGGGAAALSTGTFKK